MASGVLDLKGKCRELGYCDCRGFFGCYDPNPPAPKPVIENELEGARLAARRETIVNESDVAKNAAIIEEREARGCGYCRRKGSPCARHGGPPSYEPPKRPKVSSSEPLKDGLAESKDQPETFLVHMDDNKTLPAISSEPHSNAEPRPTRQVDSLDLRHEVIIKLAGVEITIKPVEVTP